MIELLVVVAIAAIIAAVALPNYADFVNKEKVNTMSEEFSTALVVARSAAIKGGIPVLLCASSDGEKCGTKWEDGWLAYRDDNRDSALDADDVVLLRHQMASGGTDVSMQTLAGTQVSAVRFNYRGAPDVAVTVSMARGDQDQQLTVTPFGRTRHHD